LSFVSVYDVIIQAHALCLPSRGEKNCDEQEHISDELQLYEKPPLNETSFVKSAWRTGAKDFRWYGVGPYFCSMLTWCFVPYPLLESKPYNGYVLCKSFII